MTPLEQSTIPELIAELERRSVGMVVAIVTASEGHPQGCAYIDWIHGRDPWIILGLADHIRGRAEHYARANHVPI